MGAYSVGPKSHGAGGIKGVSKREEEPRVLTVDEFHLLLEQIKEEPFRTMVLATMSRGLRCSELLGLKWSEFAGDDLTLMVQRAIVCGRVDEVKKMDWTFSPLSY